MVVATAAHVAALGQMDLGALTADQRRNLASFFNVHEAGLAALHEHSRRHAPPPAPSAGPQKVTDAEYTRMSHAEKMDYARQFDQSQFHKGERSR